MGDKETESSKEAEEHGQPTVTVIPTSGDAIVFETPTVIQDLPEDKGGLTPLVG